MFRRCQQLQVQVELDEEVDGNVWIVGGLRLTQLLNFFGLIFGEFRPFAEVGRLVGIA